MTPTTAAVIAVSAPAQRLVAAQGLDERGAQEDPQEAGHERHPGGQQAAQRSGHHRIEPARITEGGHEPDELRDHDERAGRRLRHAQAVQHLAWTQPVVMLHGLLGDVGQHGIGTAEGHDRHLAEEDRCLSERAACTQRDQQQNDRHQPQREPDRCRPQRTGDSYPSVGGKSFAEQAVGVRDALLRAAVAAALEHCRPGPSAKPPDQPRGDDDDRKRHAEEEDRRRTRPRRCRSGRCSSGRGRRPARRPEAPRPAPPTSGRRTARRPRRHGPSQRRCSSAP